MFKSAATIRSESSVPTFTHQPMPPTSYPTFELSVFSDIGGRKYQEDRFTFCPTLIRDTNDSAFFGVFDGTVGDFASETVKELVVPHLVGCAPWKRFCELLKSSVGTPSINGSSSKQEAEMVSCLREAVICMYRNADDELVQLCAQNQKDYASSTSITAILAGGYLAVGHLGDSRIALGRETAEGLRAEFLTNDHKPDQPLEKQRILSSGGSVEYLHNHNNKPFIRGGDFTVRKLRGEQPMQLQYSRAFGGKDLKKFGLQSSRCPNTTDVHELAVYGSSFRRLVGCDGRRNGYQYSDGRKRRRAKSCGSISNWNTKGAAVTQPERG